MLFAICKNKVIAVQRTAETQEKNSLTNSVGKSILLTYHIYFQSFSFCVLHNRRFLPGITK